MTVPTVDDQDYTPWGIGEDSDAIEIRFSGETERGTRFTDGVLLILGHKNEDGSAYYAKSETNFIRQPIINLPAEWVDTFVGTGREPAIRGTAERKPTSMDRMEQVRPSICSGRTEFMVYAC